jgi:hypothetical protein
MIAYLYQGPKNQVSTTANPISIAECDALFADAVAGGIVVVRTENTVRAEFGDMIAFAVLGTSQGDYYRAAKAAGLL